MSYKICLSLNITNLVIRCAIFYCSQWLNAELNTSYAGICSMSSYLSSIIYASRTEARMSWNYFLTELSYEGKVLILDQLRLGIKDALGDLEKSLLLLSGGTWLPYEISPTHTENMADTKYGASYLNERFTVPHALLKHLTSNPECKLLRKNAQGKTEIDLSLGLSFLKQCSQIVKLLSCLNQITSGQPMRTTEVIDQRIRNTERNRAIYKDHGEVLIIINYTKTSNNKGYDSFLPHKLPRCLAKLLEYYLIKVRPLETIIAFKLFGEQEAKTFHFYLYTINGKRMSAKVFRDCFQVFMQKYIKFPGGVAIWRQMVTAIKREYILPIYLKKSSWEDAGDSQAGHTSLTANKFYGLTKHQMANLTVETLLCFIQFSIKFIEFLGLDGMTPPLPLRKVNLAFAAINPPDILIRDTNIYGPPLPIPSTELQSSGQVSAALSTIASEEIITKLQAEVHGQLIGMEDRLKQSMHKEVADETAHMLQEMRTEMRQFQTSVLSTLSSLQQQIQASINQSPSTKFMVSSVSSSAPSTSHQLSRISSISRPPVPSSSNLFSNSNAVSSRPSIVLRTESPHMQVLPSTASCDFESGDEWFNSSSSELLNPSKKRERMPNISDSESLIYLKKSRQKSKYF